MAQPPILEGTWEELKRHEKELAGKRFRLVPLPPQPEETSAKARPTRRNSAQKPGSPAKRKLSGMGKFAGILPTSEEFMRQKQEDIELEERKFRG